MKHFAPQYPESTDNSLKKVRRAVGPHTNRCSRLCPHRQPGFHSLAACAANGTVWQGCATHTRGLLHKWLQHVDSQLLCRAYVSSWMQNVSCCAVMWCDLARRPLRCTWRLFFRRWPSRRTPRRLPCRHRRESLQAQAQGRGAGQEASRGSARVAGVATRYAWAWLVCCAGGISFVSVQGH
jgi:hypothetical protein